MSHKFSLQKRDNQNKTFFHSLHSLHKLIIIFCWSKRIADLKKPTMIPYGKKERKISLPRPLK